MKLSSLLILGLAILGVVFILHLVKSHGGIGSLLGSGSAS